MIGIIGAMDSEIESIKNKMTGVKEKTISNMSFYTGKLKNVDVVLAKCFEGKVNASVCTQTMILKFNPKSIINIGVAGAISDKLNIGGIAVSSSTVEFDFDTTALGYDIGYVFGLDTVYMKCDEKISSIVFDLLEEKENVVTGVIASSDKFLSEKEDKDYLKENFDDIIAVDMESASICHVCNLNNIPYCAIRAISDTADNIEFREFLNIATEKLDNIIMSVIDKI